jgi:signal transduction histidine kinase
LNDHPSEEGYRRPGSSQSAAAPTQAFDLPGTELPKRPPYASIQWRITVRLLPIVFLLFALVLYWLSVYLKSVLYQDNLEVAKRSSLAAVYAVQASMVGRDGHEIWDRVVRKIPRQQGTDIEIIGAGGEVLFSTDPERRGANRDLRDPECSTCHESGSRRATTETAFIHDPDDEVHRVFAAPLRNTIECRTCHEEQGAKLGVVFVRQPLSAVHAQIRTVQLALAFAGVVVCLLTILATRAVLSRFLGRPLRKLVAGAQMMGAGRLNHVIELPEQGELDLLADTLNTSARRLEQLQRERLAEERLATIGETVTGLAHCLKNTLNGLRAGQYVVDRALATQDEEKLSRGWRAMKSAIRQVERLAFDMLYYAKDRVPEREPCDVNDTVQTVAEVMQEDAALRGVEIRLELGESRENDTLDCTAIYRAVLNLVTNGIDACVESDTGDLVTIRTEFNAEEITITVVDNGIGIPDWIVDNLFVRFFSTKETKGTGLGLPVVRKIAEEHGGTVEIESQLDQGSTFRIHLPRGSESGEQEPPVSGGHEERT